MRKSSYRSGKLPYTHSAIRASYLQCSNISHKNVTFLAKRAKWLWYIWVTTMTNVNVSLSVNFRAYSELFAGTFAFESSTKLRRISRLVTVTENIRPSSEVPTQVHINLPNLWETPAKLKAPSVRQAFHAMPLRFFRDKRLPPTWAGVRRSQRTP